MENKNSAIDEINLIKQMVNESQGLFPFNSSHFMLWGLAIPLATLITLILDIKGLESFIGLNWGVICGLGTIASIVLGVKQGGKHKTTISEVYKMVWIGVLIGNAIIITSLFLGYVPLNVVLAVVAMILGMAFITTGFLQKNIIIKTVAILWYVLAIVMLVVRNENSGYIMGISSFFLNFLPGFVLRKKK